MKRNFFTYISAPLSGFNGAFLTVYYLLLFFGEIVENSLTRFRSQLCINTAIVYMHRFYVFHSFTNFSWHQMAAAALFLAAKVEEQPRKLEYVIRVANMCRNNRDTNIDVNSER